MKRAWFLALLPLSLGLVSAGIIVAVSLPNPVFFVRIDLAVLALLAGGLLTGLGLALYANLVDESTSDRAVLYRSLDGGLTWESLTTKF